MALFGRFGKKVSEEELAAKEENKALLEVFTPTKSWGVKKIQVATQFMYDEDMQAFVVVPGPDETFKERNPFVIRFDQVEDVWLEVDEWWTENDNKFDMNRPYKILLQEDYKNVFWRYDFYLNIKTSHPFSQDIRYQMNYSTNILKVPGFHLFYHKGLEVNGVYRGKEITAEVKKLEEFCEQIKDGLKKEKAFDILTQQRPDSILGKLEKDMTADWYVSRIENIINHMKRAARISKVLGKY